MPTWGWIVIGIGAVVVLAAAGWTTIVARRRGHLRERFGPEYHRAVAERGSRREAESELREREKRREALDVRPLEPEEQVRYQQAWQRIQARFVDEPEEAVQEADALVERVMRDCGYPVEDFEEQAATVSVDHPTVVENYRAAHRIAHEGNGAGTEDLRQAMVHYRALFQELVESGGPVREEAK
jgi:NAD(P)-dependent dehydrogenase (short-subunit alcohol dehydrogenase family)